MLFKTKLFRNVNKIFYILKKRILIVQNSFSLALFSLFLGFLCGNLFGTFLDTLRIYFLWNGFVAFIILLFIEAINFFVYRIPLTEKINTKFSVSNVQNFSNLLGRSIKLNLHFLYALLNPFLTKRGYKAKNLRNNSATQLRMPLGKEVNALQPAQDFLFDNNKKIIFTIYIERSLNAFKIGLLFGFFIDSFKVGS